MDELRALAERVLKGSGFDNATDVLVEIALFEPDSDYAAIRANAAGSKVICTRHDGSERTFRALDWTMDRHGTAIALRARANSTGGQNGG